MQDDVTFNTPAELVMSITSQVRVLYSSQIDFSLLVTKSYLIRVFQTVIWLNTIYQLLVTS